MTKIKIIKNFLILKFLDTSYIKFDSMDKQFIEIFTKLEFEKIFKDNINDFLNKIVSKINTTFNFGIIMDLIDIENIKDKSKDKDKIKDKSKEYFFQLKQKYEYVIKKDIISLKGEKYFRMMNKKTIDLLKNIDKDKKISPLIYNELIRNCQEYKYALLKDFFYKNSQAI